jgi:uncharacterized protein YdeI (BOF family)
MSRYSFTTADLLSRTRRLSLGVLILLLGAILAACGQDQTAVEPSPIPGQGGLSSDPAADEPLVTSPAAPTAATDEPLVTSPVAPTAAAQPMTDDGTAITLSDIDDNVEQYLGQTVTVNGEVDEALGANAFRMDEGNLLDLGDQILVVLAADAQRPTTLVNETSVQVTGVVQNFARADFEQQYGFAFDDEDLYAEWEGRPTIIANRVMTRATVSDIDDDAEAYLGNRVAVQGDVTEIIDERTFRLDDPALLGGDDILVTTAQAGMTVNVGDQVWVVGVVREFDRAAIGEETGYTYSDEVYSPFAEGTVIVAEDVQVSGQTEPRGDMTGGVFADDSWEDNSVGINDIVADPTQYVGQQVTLGAEVNEVLSPNVVRMGEDNLFTFSDSMLVVIPDDAQRPANLQDGTRIQATGTVRNFVQAEFQRDYNIFSDADLYAEYENRPVLVADRVYVQATLSDVDDDPEAYLGNRVSVFGQVEEIFAQGQFRLEDPQLFAGDDLLVILRDQSVAVNEDDYLRVTGIVQRFNQAEVERELGFPLEGDWFAGWDDRTVIIADNARPRR